MYVNINNQYAHNKMAEYLFSSLDGSQACILGLYSHICLDQKTIKNSLLCLWLHFSFKRGDKLSQRDIWETEKCHIEREEMKTSEGGAWFSNSFSFLWRLKTYFPDVLNPRPEKKQHNNQRAGFWCFSWPAVTTQSRTFFSSCGSHSTVLTFYRQQKHIIVM